MNGEPTDRMVDDEEHGRIEPNEADRAADEYYAELQRTRAEWRGAVVTDAGAAPSGESAG